MIITDAILIYKFIKRVPLVVVLVYILPFLAVSLHDDHVKLNETERVESFELVHTVEVVSHGQVGKISLNGSNNFFHYGVVFRAYELVEGFIPTQFLKLYILFQTASDSKKQVLFLR